MMSGVSLPLPQIYEGEWGVSYFWYWMNWIARLDVFVLALMLTFVIVVFSRAFCRNHSARRAQDTDTESREYRELIAELSIQLFLNSERQDSGGLAGRLSKIYGMEVHRSLCLLADEGVPFQTVANVLDTVKNTPAKITVWLATPQSPQCSLP